MLSDSCHCWLWDVIVGPGIVFKLLLSVTVGFGVRVIEVGWLLQRAGPMHVCGLSTGPRAYPVFTVL